MAGFWSDATRPPGTTPETPQGWFISGDGFKLDGGGYQVKLDATAAQSGRQSLRMQSTGKGQFGNAEQRISAVAAAKKKIRIGGHIKTEGITTGYAGLWCRVDGPNGMLAHDNMAVRYGPKGVLVKEDDRGARGTTPWTRYQIDHDVDASATNISFGALLTGDGTAWFDAFTIEVDGIPFVAAPGEPRAIKEVMPAGWYKAVSNGTAYDAGIDRAVTHAGKAAAHIKPIVDEPGPQFFGNLMQTVNADEFKGKRIAVSAYLKTESVTGGARMWVRVDGTTKDMLSFDNMQKRPMTGTGDWKRCEIVLDVPEDSVGIAFGVMLAGKGQVWFDDLAFSLVAEDVPTTDLRILPTSLTKAQQEEAKIRYQGAPKKPRNLDFEE